MNESITNAAPDAGSTAVAATVAAATAVPRKKRDDADERFVAWLRRLDREDDRAALAKLRRSLVNFGDDFSAYAVLGGALPAGLPEWKLEDYVLVAGLSAMHRDWADDDRSLGNSLRRLRHALSDAGEGSLDLLFTALLNAEREELPVRLRHVITRLAAKEIAIDYARLLEDLGGWQHPRRFVQRKWAHDYWVGERPHGNAEQPDNETADTLAEPGAAE